MEVIIGRWEGSLVPGFYDWCFLSDFWHFVSGFCWFLSYLWGFLSDLTSCLSQVS